MFGLGIFALVKGAEDKLVVACTLVAIFASHFIPETHFGQDDFSLREGMSINRPHRLDYLDVRTTKALSKSSHSLHFLSGLSFRNILTSVISIC